MSKHEQLRLCPHLGSIVFPQWRPVGSEDAEEGPFSRKSSLLTRSDSLLGDAVIGHQRPDGVIGNPWKKERAHTAQILIQTEISLLFVSSSCRAKVLCSVGV